MMEGYAVVFVAGFLAGFINSVAGGGTLITFPSLVWAGLDPVVANMTNTVALWVGSLGGAWGFRKNFYEVKNLILPFLVVSSVGAILGAFLLLYTPSSTFKNLVPFLILLAVLLLALSETIKKALIRLPFGRFSFLFSLFLQFITGVYGSYFGAGIGIMMLTSLSLSGIGNIHIANALKNMLGFVINLIGAFIFALSGKVNWHFVVLLMPSFALGGYAGAKISLKFHPRTVKFFVVLWGILVCLYTLLK